MARLPVQRERERPQAAKLEIVCFGSERGFFNETWTILQTGIKWNVYNMSDLSGKHCSVCNGDFGRQTVGFQGAIEVLASISGVIITCL